VQTCREEIDRLKTRVDKLSDVGREMIRTSAEAGHVMMHDRPSDVETPLVRLLHAFSQLQHKHQSRSDGVKKSCFLGVIRRQKPVRKIVIEL